MANRWHLPVIVALFVLMAGAYSVVTPLFEAPDEVWHYGYVYWVAGGNGLAAPDKTDGLAFWAQEGSQPPLYYLLAGLLTGPLPRGDWATSVRYNPHAALGNADSFGNRNYLLHGAWDAWPWRGIALSAHLARLCSILLGAVTVVFTYLMGRQLAPDWELAAALAAALVAFNPQFLFLSASVSNDNLVTAISAAGVWLCVRVAGGHTRPATRWLVALGAVVGLAALAKLSGLLLGALALAALGLAGRRLRSWRFWLGGSALVVVVAVAVAGWWYWRNWTLVGDPLGLAGMFAVLPARAEPLGAAQLLALAPGIWRSTWAVFGWFNVAVDAWVYWLYSGLAALGCAGWLIVVLNPRRRLESGLRPTAAGLLAGWSLVVALALLRWAQINYPQGRLLFPAIAAAMALLAVGLLAWWPRRWRPAVTAAVATSMAVLAAAAPFVWIAPAYVPAAPLAAEITPVNPGQGAVGEHAALVGYSYAAEQLVPGGQFDITLYWRGDAPLARDYSVFVHLVDELGIVQAQSDSYPAQGSRPTSGWQPWSVVVDRHRLQLPPTLPAPGTLRIETGMYDHAGGERLPTAQGDNLVLGEVDTAALSSPSGIPNPMRVEFGDKIALTGYSVDRRSLRPGESMQLSLWWQGLARMEQDYVVFVHLMLPPDAVWAQHDRQPQDGAARTSTWQVGRVVQDDYTLTIPEDAPPGIYDIAVGIYDKDSFERLAVNAGDRPVVVARVRVEP
jgi:hypothetical protein